MELFYSNNISGNHILFDEEESSHCTRVLRHVSGDELMVTDGKGKLYGAILLKANKKECELQILKLHREEGESIPKIQIAIAPVKVIDRFEWFLEKATEIGVSKITPLICKRSERTKLRMDRCEKIILAAMKQANRLWKPELNKLILFDEFFSRSPLKQGLSFIAHCQSQNLPSLRSLYKQETDVIVMIGPEGDFTNEEISLAEEMGFRSVSLSKARLRTETAGIVAIHTIRLLND